jgi:hypothetical protein
MILAVALSCSAFAQQGNGRNYSSAVQQVGNMLASSYDIGVNGYLLTVPVKTGAGPYSSWGQFRFKAAAADTAGTNHHGMALYSAAGTLLCSTYPVAKTSFGVNSLSLSGCGVPLPNTSYTIAYLTEWSGDEPGINNSAAISTFVCPGTSSFAGYAAAASFPTTLPRTSAQNFCYAFWADVIVPGGSNGKYYGGNAGFNAVSGIPTGPWGANGAWYGGLNVADTFVNFSDGLSNGVYPTTTALGNSDHGTACTWELQSTQTVISGAAAGHRNLITPVSTGGVGYGGAGSLTFQYLTNSTDSARNYGTCAYASGYTTMSVGYHIKTDVPDTDTFNNQYDSGGAWSLDNYDQVSPAIMAGNVSGLYMIMQCEINGTGVANSSAIPMQTNTNYWVWILKGTNAATQWIYLFNQDQGGTYVGRISCTSGKGSHPAGIVFTPINGSEANTSGYHVWVDQYEVNTSGAFLAP